MTTSSSPGIAVATLGALLFRNLEEFGTDRLLRWHDGTAEVTYSSARFADGVLRLACWFASNGFADGDRVAILAENRPEWHMVDFAAHLAGLAPVPIYATLSDEQTRYILEHSGARAIFCGRNIAQQPGLQVARHVGQDAAARVERLREGLPELKHVIAFDGRFEELLRSQPEVTGDARSAMRARALAGDPDALATIVYTSGTTGKPKGVMLTHRNLVSNVLSAIDRLPRSEADSALSVLPLAHLFERMLCYCYFYQGVAIAYGEPSALKELLPRYRPQIMAVVPRMLEKMRESFEAGVSAQPVRRQKLARFLLRCGYDRVDGRMTARAWMHPLAERLLFRRVRAQFGGIRTLVAGGAWLSPELERFFQAIGFRVLQGYGMTETAPVIACNEIGQERMGTVGRILRGVEARIDEAGEILVRGPNVMRGYFRNPEATEVAFRDGWFLTGDLGSIDADGYLTITGRRKEMLLLSNGKNVYYPPIEQALKQSPYIEQALIVGEGRNYAAVMILPNLTSLKRFAEERGMFFQTDAELLLSKPVQSLYQSAIESLTAEFARFEQPKRFGFLTPEILQDPDLVTPTMKVRPGMLEKRYTLQIDAFYSGQTCTIVSR